jgi:hypothetical protein
MNSSNKSETAIKIFSAIFISFAFCLVLLCCGAYLFLKKENKKQNQIHFTNHRHPSEPHAQIFTIDLPDKPPPSYESTQESFSG